MRRGEAVRTPRNHPLPFLRKHMLAPDRVQQRVRLVRAVSGELLVAELHEYQAGRIRPYAVVTRCHVPHAVLKRVQVLTDAVFASTSRLQSIVTKEL